MSKDIFSNNPTLDLYYKTSDGNAFLTKNAAHNHSKTLEDKSVKKVTKTSAVKEEITINVDFGKGESKTVKAEITGTEKKAEQPIQKQPEAPADQVKNEGAGDPANSEAGNIEDTAAEYNQAVSDYMEKFGEAPFEGAELKKIKWAVQFNKKLTKPE